MSAARPRRHRRQNRSPHLRVPHQVRHHPPRTWTPPRMPRRVRRGQQVHRSLREARTTSSRRCPNRCGLSTNQCSSIAFCSDIGQGTITSTRISCSRCIPRSIERRCRGRSRIFPRRHSCSRRAPSTFAARSPMPRAVARRATCRRLGARRRASTAASGRSCFAVAPTTGSSSVPRRRDNDATASTRSPTRRRASLERSAPRTSTGW